MTRRTSLVVRPLAAAGAGVLAAGVGLGLTWLVVRGMGPDAGMADLGVAALGLLASVGLGVVVWLVGLVRVAARLFPRGRRQPPVLISALAVFVLVVAWATLAASQEGAAARPDAEELAWLAGLVLPIVAPSVVFALWGRRHDVPGPEPGAGAARP